MLLYKLKVILADRNLTQHELAQATNIRIATVSAIATGSIKRIPVDALEKICDILDCQPGDIIKYEKSSD